MNLIVDTFQSPPELVRKIWHQLHSLADSIMVFVVALAVRLDDHVVLRLSICVIGRRVTKGLRIYVVLQEN